MDAGAWTKGRDQEGRLDIFSGLGVEVDRTRCERDHAKDPAWSGAASAP